MTYANDPSGTLAVGYSYDRRGRQRTMGQAGGTTSTFAYNDANELWTESLSGNLLNGFTVTSIYDDYLRRNSLTLNTAAALNFAYGYDSASRLQTVTDNTTTTPRSAGYSYVANSPLVGQIDYKYGTTPVTRMTTGKQFDNLDRLASVVTTDGSQNVVNSFDYSYNNANQRIRTTLADNSYWDYTYDSLGQVTSGKRH